ncbi:MAG: hypothetical protein H7A55_22570 [Verrucomicrobiaceae bacterium]|nr:hypothetical protein [Verrucomicrobiaceae bacterium]
MRKAVALFFLASLWSFSQAAEPVIAMRLLSPTPHEGVSEMKTGDEMVWVEKEILIDDNDIASAALGADRNGPIVTIKFTKEGSERFAKVTKASIGMRLAIIHDGKILMAPVIRDEITGGEAILSGRFSEAEAGELSAKINKAAKVAAEAEEPSS